MSSIKSHLVIFFTELPLIGIYLKKLVNRYRTRNFGSSAAYWESRYKSGGSSGSGSYNRLASYKAEYLNKFVSENKIASVAEFGCGDGNQLLIAEYPTYHGYDVSGTVIDLCRVSFAHDEAKTFSHINDYEGEKYELILSLDVIYHLVEDSVFFEYMARCFAAAEKYVVIYSSNDSSLNEKYGGGHVRHHKFSDWIDANAPEFRLRAVDMNKLQFDPKDPENTSLADFYIYQKLET